MASFAGDETISRIVETYGSMLLRLTCTRLDDPADVAARLEDGAISLAEGVTGALFTLPLDASKADPAASEAFAKSTGLEFTEGGDDAVAVTPAAVILGEN